MKSALGSGRSGPGWFILALAADLGTIEAKLPGGSGPLRGHGQPETRGGGTGVMALAPGDACLALPF